ncbi:MAG TPA: hypothetical protein DCZ01_04965 [Elusimicrobia bacterium]|nr:MAG: hypothetical protein A2X40_00220 [Elusimicrobia bacterium GWC2_65_9]OHC66016.1 MAG: hypothetical protein A2040_03465 [Rhodocyclales bacterium GWA2_65_19]HAZ07874.1 hypothetical protein [Elusimicrobiota bacterium]
MPHTETPIALVVGADGLIGNALLAKLAAAGSPVVGTTRRNPAGCRVVRLDLSEPPASWRLPPSVSTAFLCAGLTKTDDCRKNPVSSSRINVDAVGSLAGRLADHGAFVVFLSSSQVFSGAVARCAQDAPPDPISEYGRQKAATERRVLSLGKRGAAVRLTKVAETLLPLFSRWEAALRHGQEIRPFSDMTAAPVPLSLVVEALTRLADRRLAGITQVSADRDLSYADMARLVAVHAGADPALIHPILAKESGLDLEAIANRTALDTTRLRRELGLIPPDAAACIAATLASGSAAKS